MHPVTENAYKTAISMTRKVCGGSRVEGELAPAVARVAPDEVSDAPQRVPADAAQEAEDEVVEINGEDETIGAEVEPLVVAPSPNAQRCGV